MGNGEAVGVLVRMADAVDETMPSEVQSDAIN